MSLTMSGLNATLWLQAASVVGVLFGGWLADLWSRTMAGGRPLVQAIGLFAGAPLIALAGWTLDVPTLVIAMAGFGFCKGMYDANIWASLYDVVPAATAGDGPGTHERDRLARRRGRRRSPLPLHRTGMGWARA